MQWTITIHTGKWLSLADLWILQMNTSMTKLHGDDSSLSIQAAAQEPQITLHFLAPLSHGRAREHTGKQLP
jgi:hypothetical protein